MSQDSSETGESSLSELWRRASRQSDLEAWAAFQQGLEGMLLTWFHTHPGSEEASHVQSDRQIATRAFEQVWHLVIQGQVVCETLSEVVVYLHASLCGAILETLRVSGCPGAASSSWADREECPETGVVWDRIQEELTIPREQRLAYLLYQCGMEPAEVVRTCPQEWSDIHEMARLRHSILVRLMQSPVLISTAQEGESSQRLPPSK